MLRTLLIINDFCHVNGGAAQVAIDSAIGLSDAGFKVGFIGMVGPIDERLSNHPNLTVFCAHGKTFLDAESRIKAAFEGWWSKSTQAFLGSVLTSYDSSTTLVHVHGWVKAFSPSIFPILKAKGFRVVITLHDYFLACPNGGFLEYPTTQICRRKALSVSCFTCNCDSRSYSQKLWRYGRGIVQTYGVKLGESVDGFVGVSQFSLDKLSGYLDHNIPVKLVRNPISVIQSKHVGGNATGPLLFVGRLSREKGATLALEAARRLCQKIIVVGQGEQLTELKSAYPEATFTGWRSRDYVIKLMKEASCLVFPSLWYETNGMVVLEAMSQGLPIVVSDGTAPMEFVEDGVNGRVFRMGDIDDLTNIVAQILGGQGGVLSKAAWESYWSNPWTLKAHIDELRSFYEEVIAFNDFKE